MADFGFGVAGVGDGGLKSDAGQVLVLVGGDSADQPSGLVEAWPERIDRRVAAMEKQVRELSVLLHRLMNPGEEPDAAI